MPQPSTAGLGRRRTRQARKRMGASASGLQLRGMSQPASTSSASALARGTRRRIEHPMSNQLVQIQLDRREAIGKIGGLLAVGMGLATTACNPMASGADREAAHLEWDAFFQGNFRLMTDDEKDTTVTRLERLYELKNGKRIEVSEQGPRTDVLYGYAFNISK